MIDAMLRAWGRFVALRPRASALLVIAFTLGALALLPRFRLDPDIAALLPAGNKTAELLQVTQLGSKNSRTLLLLLRGERLEERLPALLDSLSASPYLALVAGTREAFAGDRLPVYKKAPLWFLPEAQLAALEERLTEPGMRAAIEESKNVLAEDALAGRQIVQRDPLGLREIYNDAARAALPPGLAADTPYLLLDQRRTAVVRVVGQKDAYDVAYANALLADVEARAAGFDLRTVGGYSIARSMAAGIRRDLMTSTLLSIPMVLVFLIASTREVRMSHLLLLPACLAIVWALGYGGAILGPLTPLAVSAAAILTGLGVDYPIYYLRRFRAERRAADYPTAIEATHRTVGRGILAGMATTGAAFLCFGIGSFRGLGTFGVLLALGLLLAFIATLALFPLLLRGERPLAQPERAAFVARQLERPARSRCARPIALFLVLTGLAGWSWVAVRGLTFDADPRRLRAEDRALDALVVELERDLGFAPIPVVALVPARTPLPDVKDRVDALREAGHIGFASGPQEYAPVARRAAAVAALRERCAGWVEGALADLGAAGFAPERFRASLEEHAAALRGDPAPPPEAMQPFEWRGQRWWKIEMHPTRTLATRADREQLHAAVRAALGGDCAIADAGALADELGPLLAHDVRQALGVCLLLVIALTTSLIGSIARGLLALVPVLTALGILLGSLSLLGAPLHPGNFVSLPLILGSGVNYGILMVLAAREGNPDPLRANGTAIWRAAVTTMLGFGSLITASNPGLSSLGAIVLGGMALSLLASLWILPPWLRRRCNASSSPVS